MHEVTTTSLSISILLAVTLALPPPAAASSYQEIEHSFANCDIARLEHLAMALAADTEHTADKQQYYLLAFSHYRLAAALIQQDRSREAAATLTDAIATSRAITDTYPDFADGHVLLGALYGMQILLSPFKAIYLAPRADAAVQRGLELDPQNSRAYLMQGVTALQTPAVFGGNDKQALALLTKGLEAHQRKRSEVSWGEVDLYLWLGRTYARLDRDQDAQQAYRQALKISPANCWVEEAIRGDGYRFEDE